MDRIVIKRLFAGAAAIVCIMALGVSCRADNSNQDPVQQTSQSNDISTGSQTHYDNICSKLHREFPDVLAEVLPDDRVEKLLDTTMDELLEGPGSSDLLSENVSRDDLREELSEEFVCLTITPVWDINVRYYASFIAALRQSQRHAVESIIFKYYLELSLRDETSGDEESSPTGKDQKELESLIAGELRQELAAILDAEQLSRFDAHPGEYSRMKEKESVQRLLQAFDAQNPLSDEAKEAILNTLGELRGNVLAEFSDSTADFDLKEALSEANSEALRRLSGQLTDDEYSLAETFMDLFVQPTGEDLE